MALHKDFPQSPHAILNPEMRWFPADDYAKLFMHYRKHLPTQSDGLEQVEQLLKKHKRIALTCFEKEHSSCHRHCVSELLEKEGSFRVCHL